MKPLNSIIYPKWTQSITMALFLLAVSSTSFAQSSYGVIHPWGATHTINRAWPSVNDKWIEYSYGGIDNGFYLRDHFGSPIKFASFSDVIVTDFEILHDTVFFCGYNNSGCCVGSFDIGLVFNGSGCITYALLEDIYGVKLFDIATKIAVYKGAYGTEMAVVGETSNQYGVTSSGIADVLWTPTMHLHYYYIDPTGVEVFEDVAITDHYVVAVENKGYPHGSHCMRVFKRSNYTGNSFLSSSIGDTIHYIHTSNYSKNLVTHINGDTFAIAVIRLEQSNTYGNSLLLYDGTTYLGNTYMPLANFYDTRWKLYDFRYNKLDRGLYLLEDIYNQTTGDTASSMLFRFDHPYYQGTAVGYFTTIHESWKSFDCNAIGFINGTGVSAVGEMIELKWMPPQPDNCLSVKSYAHSSVLFVPDSIQSVIYPPNNPPSMKQPICPLLYDLPYEIRCK